MRKLGVTLAVLAALAPGAAAAPPCTEGPWCDSSLPPDRRAELLLAQMTPEEKFELMAGDDPMGVFTGDPAQGTSRGVPRLGIPTIYMNDGPAGIREGTSTGLPAPIGLAATFDRRAARRTGEILGDEAWNKGGHLVHAPAVNIARVPLGGRTFEYFGEDPYLAARTAVAETRGIEGEGVVANVKHYMANNQETDRFVTNAVVDERTLREIYLPAFEATVTEAGIGSVMLAYNRVNGKYMTENGELVNGLLKSELGFKGIALTDYGFAQHSTAESALAGNDLEMPQAGWYSRTALTTAVATGAVPMAVIDEHVHRILRTYFRYGFFERELPAGDEGIDEAAHGQVAREIEEQAITLLRNERGLLPLDAGRLRSIAVIGPEANVYRNGGGSSNVRPNYAVTPLDGIRTRAGQGVDVRFDDGRDHARAAEVARGADVAVVVANDNQTEFVDKPCLSLQCGDPDNGDQDGLIEAVAAANEDTVVVLETGGPVLMPWLDQVPAVLEAWYPGQEGGHAIARVLFGDVDPGGRLPITFPRRESDPPTAGHPERYPGVAENAHYDEGIFVGYRHYDENEIAPLFAFGHGLSYTSFRYSKLRIRKLRGGNVRVRARVRNTGSRPGTEVAQLYLGIPQVGFGSEQPPKALKGYRKVSLGPGERRRVSFRLDRRAFSYWDTDRDAWILARGCHRVMVGRSSRDIRLRGRLTRGRGARC